MIEVILLGGTCSNPKWKSNNWYCTWLNYWDYNQHHYTTTKVKLYWVNVSCSKTEYSDGSASQIIAEAYDGTLSWIRSPEFSWPITIDWQQESDWGITIYSNDKLNISWLKYKIVWKVWDKISWVKKIETTIKKNDFTLWKDDKILSNIKNTKWLFSDFNVIIKNSFWDIITKKAWNYQIVFTFFDENWQPLGTYETPLTIIPNNNIKISNIILSNTVSFATNNNTDKLNLCGKITDNFWNIVDKNYELNYNYNWYKNNINILDWIKDTNNKQSIDISNTSFKNSEICFNINSVVPFLNKNLKFNIKIPLHKEDISLDKKWTYKKLVITTPELTFKKPVEIWKFLINWEKPIIWKKQKYLIWLDNIWWLNWFSNWKIYLTKNNIQNLVLWHYWKLFLKDNYDFSDSLNNNLSFYWLIDATDNVLKAVDLKLKDLSISYNLNWHFIKYKLNNSIELTWWANCNRETLWVKIYGQLQWNWKSELTWQKVNISDLTKSSLRAEIRKNAYKNIINRNSSKTNNVEWIIYVKWNVKYSEIESKLNPNDTIVVKDWNFIIDKNIDKNIWIIVLKDNYNINNDYNKAWNIYVNNDITSINALIYADWTFRSATDLWNKYSDSELNKRLILNGSLFTRNTIGWAIKWSTNYTLPGWKVTTNYDLASLYDLNYLRKVPMLCDLSKDDWYSFIIKYNTQNQINPPKLFGK